MPKTGSYGVNAKNSNILSTLPANDKAELVSVKNNQVVTSSLQVAEYFGKRHKDVLRSISMLECSMDFNQRNFAPVTYKDAKGEQRPMYYLTRDGFTFLAMGFTGKIAAKFKETYINAFNEMEEMLRSNQATEYAKKILKAQIEVFNKNMKQAVENGRKQHGEYYGACGDMIPKLPFFDHMSFEENIKNELAWISCAYSDSMYFISQLAKKDEELKKLKKSIARFTCDIQSKIDLY